MTVRYMKLDGTFISNTWGASDDVDAAIKAETTELERYYRSIIQALVYTSPEAKLRIGMFDWENSWNNYALECVREGDDLVFSVVHKEGHDHKAAFDDLMQRCIHPPKEKG